jgi:alpha-D-xyloside xylohydrolase
VPEALQGSPVPFSVEETADTLRLSTEAVSIEVDCETAAFTYRAADGSLLTREPARGGKTLDPIDVHVSVFDEADVVVSEEQIDGIRMNTRNVREVVVRRAYHTKIEFEWADGEALYGLGSHEEGMFNLRGQRYVPAEQRPQCRSSLSTMQRDLDCTSLGLP